jgi:predicted unusual protein kinase regulating ubiquinone biosynthesis (AarF/ABC1/UbiB family)
MNDLSNGPSAAPKGHSETTDREKNRFSARAMRYSKVSANVGGVAARIAGRRLFGLDSETEKEAAALAMALGGLKGPIMKVAQLLATIPDALPPEYAEALGKLQTHAPPMGRGFVRRRMAAELGPDWESKFASFDYEAAASASLGQVHRAIAHDGRDLAVKLQYPDMRSAVEADLVQLGMLFSVHRRMRPAVETSEVLKELSARLREELDYQREAGMTRLYGEIFSDDAYVRVPDVLSGLSTDRVLTMTWLDGRKLLEYKGRPLNERNEIARAMFRAWWHPWRSAFG